MYIDRLKRKYQQILHGTERKENGQNHHSLTPKSTSKVDKKTKLLTEHCENTYKNSAYSSSSSYVLALKERLAQSTHNFKEKEEQCAKFREEIVRKDEQIRLMELQLNETKAIIENSEKKVVEAKVVSAGLEKNIEVLQKQIEAYAIDKELALKQAQFYKKQSCKVRKQKKSVQKVINSSQKYVEEMELICNQNNRLRQDIKRMQVVINEMCHQKQGINLAEKHYLGKPIKQASSWFPQNLVGQVQYFLKKEQIAQGNKQFLNNLVKFISKYATSVSKNSTKPSQTNSRVKSMGKNSHCRSISLCEQGYNSYYDPGTSFIRKTQGIGTSVLKKSLLLGKCKKQDLRKYTIESLMLPERQGQNTVCSKILNEYKKVLNQALSQKEVKAKVILGLTEEMSSAIAELFQSRVN